jgi:cyclophilin family peptidyl-prolyl cis-trans isomerase
LNPIKTLFSILLAISLAGCGESGGSDASSGSGTQAATPGSGEPVNPMVARSLARDPGPSSEHAIIRTNYGDIKLRFFPKQAPLAVANFKGLAAQGFYNGLTFHRILSGFMIQGGDPNGDGTGGESIWKKPFRDEFHPALVYGRAGLVGMANSSPNNNGSQFFITTDETPHLNNKHTLFAEVMEGMASVNAIASMETNADAKPLEPVIIEEVIITDD